MSFTNTSPFQVPTRASKPALGTNPIAFAAPGKDGDHFVLGMATSTVALGKVEVCPRKGATIPNSWGVDSSGLVSLCQPTRATAYFVSVSTLGIINFVIIIVQLLFVKCCQFILDTIE